MRDEKFTLVYFSFTSVLVGSRLKLEIYCGFIFT
jgi:hypothetical protein